MNNRIILSAVGIVTACAGCSSNPSLSPGTERGPNGTVGYKVLVEASDPDARVEVNESVVGKTPITITIFGDKDGTFHNFGSSEFVIRVFPVREGQHAQTKTFRTGGMFGQEDRVPSHLFFDLNQKHESFSIEPAKPRY